MTPRADPDLLLSLGRYNRAMSAERRDLAEQVTAIVERNLGAFDTLDLVTYTLLVRPRLMRELDGVFDAFYGRFRGDQSARFLRLTTDQSRRAFAQPFARDAQDVTRRLKRFPAVLKAIRQEAA